MVVADSFFVEARFVVRLSTRAAPTSRVLNSEHTMNEDSVPFTPDISILAKAIIYLFFSLYAAFYISAQNHTKSCAREYEYQDHSASSEQYGNQDEAEAAKQLSSKKKEAAQLSCVPFIGPRARIEPGMAVDRTT